MWLTDFTCIQPSFTSFNSNKDNIKKETDNVNWCPLLGQLLFKYCGEQQQHCTSKQIWTILCHVITLIYQSQINAGYCPGAPPWRRDLRCWARTVRARTVEQTNTCGNRERAARSYTGGCTCNSLPALSFSLSLSWQLFLFLLMNRGLLHWITFVITLYLTINWKISIIRLN